MLGGVNLEAPLKRLGFGNGPMGAYQLAIAAGALGAIALFLGGALALALSAAFGAR